MMERKRFMGLDGLRGVCALSVLLYHCETLFRSGMIVCHGYLAADVFFLLSGFVITASYDHRFEAGLTARHFMMARLRRLAPVYWAGLVAGIVAAAIIAFYHPDVSAARLALWSATAAALIPIGGSRFAYPADPVAWTLAWELIVNLAYALWLRRWSSRNLILLALALWAAATLNAYLDPREWSFGMTPGDLWLGGLRALPGFVMGVVLYRVYRAGKLERLPVVTPLLPIAAWLALTVMPQALPPLFDLAVVLIASPLLVALLVRGEGGAPGWFAVLGGLSYPLYTSHLAFVYLARRTPLFGLNGVPHPLQASLVVLVAMAVAWFLYRTVDPAGKARKFPKIASLDAPGPVGSTPA